jgi:predicted metalloprotease
MGSFVRVGSLVAVVLALAIGGCGGDDEPTETTSASGATGGAGPTSEQVPLDGPPDPALTVAEIVPALPLPEPVVDDPGFKESLDILVAASHKYWSESLSDSGVPYHTPDEFVAYDGKGGNQGPDCGGEPMGAENAAYCRVPGESEYGLIGWDESALIYPLYKELGDGSTAFIMGHEYAHLAQDRLGIIAEFPLPVEKELNADCLTGAQWTAYNAAGANFTRADIKSIIDGITVVGDAPGTPWQDQHAHGSADDRLTAFFDGYENDPDYCLKHYGPGFSG